MNRASYHIFIRIVAGAIIVSIVLLQLYQLHTSQQVEDGSANLSSSIAGSKDAGASLKVSVEPPSDLHTSDQTTTTPTPRPTPIHLFNNTDLGITTKPVDQIDFCNHLVKPRHPRELRLSQTSKEPVKIFTWRPSTDVDWPKESLTLCPIPLVLQPFFDHFLETRVQDPNIKWDVGYAPCILWKQAYGEVSFPKQSCTTSNYGKVDYIVTTNYTDFEDASVIFFDYPYANSFDQAPYIDLASLPPKLSHQKWVLYWRSESVGYYPFMGLPQYLNLFDLSMGSPPDIMDIPLPIYIISDEKALEIANAPPAFPLDQTPENYVVMLVDNCGPKNRRNELMEVLINNASAHSYGGCFHNKDLPEGLGKENGPNGWGDWEPKKLKVLAGYPFVFGAENSNCRGYVTEKIYNALEVGAIPIYLGAADISDFVPEGSFVDASKFDNFEQVATFIKTVDRSRFYDWKEVVKKDPSKFCKSCQASGWSTFNLAELMCGVVNYAQFEAPITK